MLTKFSKAAQEIERWKSRAANLREKVKRPVEIGFRSAKVLGSCAAMSYYKGRNGDAEVFGMPVDLAGALAAHGAALLFGSDGTWAHLHDIGDGLAASYTSMSTYGLGLEMAAKENRTSVAEILARRARGDKDDGSGPDPDRQRNLPGGANPDNIG